MTLRELRAAHPGLFYRQDWFIGERFMERQAVPVPMPAGWLMTPDPTIAPLLLSAATICALYVTAPDNPIWSKYLWTADLDHHGQRVYVGNNGKGLEIHRHLAINDRWGVPLWS